MVNHCFFCGGRIRPGTTGSASIKFEDKTNASDIPAADIIRFAEQPEDQHEPLARTSQHLHPTCKKVLLHVKNARSKQPAGPRKRSDVGPVFDPAEPKSIPLEIRSKNTRSSINQQAVDRNHSFFRYHRPTASGTSTRADVCM